MSAISLSASILFHLVCNLQVILFEDYAKLLGRESDILFFIDEHMRLRHHLSKIIHRVVLAKAINLSKEGLIGDNLLLFNLPSTEFI